MKCKECEKRKIAEMRRSRKIRAALRKSKKVIGRRRTIPRDKVAALRALGFSYSEIANRLGATKSAICKAYKSYLLTSPW